jgi:hypothetical protein
MQCSALTKTGHPCRGYGALCAGVKPAAALCRLHREFFTGDTAYELVRKHATIYQTSQQRAWMIRMLKSPLFVWRNEYVEDLEERARSTHGARRDRALYMYDLFIRAGCLPPTTIKPLWRRRVLGQLRIVHFCVLEPNIRPHYKDVILDLLSPFFKGVDFLYGLTSLTCLMWEEPFHRDAGHGTTLHAIDMWCRVIDYLVPLMDTSVLAGFSKEVILRHLDGIHAPHPASQWHTPELRAYVAFTLKELAAVERQRVATRVAPIKEDLIKETMKPERLERLLEAGYDLCDL